jgi:hypothetical protein
MVVATRPHAIAMAAHVWHLSARKAALHNDSKWQ